MIGRVLAVLWSSIRSTCECLVGLSAILSQNRFLFTKTCEVRRGRTRVEHANPITERQSRNDYILVEAMIIIHNREFVAYDDDRIHILNDVFVYWFRVRAISYATYTYEIKCDCASEMCEFVCIELISLACTHALLTLYIR